MSSPPAIEVDLNCVRLGAGDDLVLIHGLGANLSFWFFGGAQLLAARRHGLAPPRCRDPQAMAAYKQHNRQIFRSRARANRARPKR